MISSTMEVYVWSFLPRSAKSTHEVYVAWSKSSSDFMFTGSWIHKKTQAIALLQTKNYCPVQEIFKIQ